MFKPRPFPKPTFVRPDLVSTKIETSYDAVDKIKQGYKQIVERLKSALKTPFSSIETTIEPLTSLTIDTSNAALASDFDSLIALTGDESIKQQASIITNKLAVKAVKEAINKAITAGNSIIISIDSSNIAQIPALAKQLAEYKLDTSSITESEFANLATTITAKAEDRPAVAKEIAAELIENIVTKTLDDVQALGNRIISLASTSKTTIDQVANELDKEMIVVNDLWSYKDHQIANLSAELNKAMEDLRNLQAAYDELEKQRDELQAEILASIQSSIKSQDDIQEQQSYISKIMNTAINYNTINVHPIKAENL